MKKLISDLVHSRKNTTFAYLLTHLTDKSKVIDGECCLWDSNRFCIIDGISKDLASALQTLINDDVIVVRRVRTGLVIRKGAKKYGEEVTEEVTEEFTEEVAEEVAKEEADTKAQDITFLSLFDARRRVK
jgi:hypothetical protein